MESRFPQSRKAMRSGWTVQGPTHQQYVFLVATSAVCFSVSERFSDFFGCRWGRLDFRLMSPSKQPPNIRFADISSATVKQPTVMMHGIWRCMNNTSGTLPFLEQTVSS